MPNEHGHWRSDERSIWKPEGACAKCGSENLRPTWQDVLDQDNGAEQWYVPAEVQCQDCASVVGGQQSTS